MAQNKRIAQRTKRRLMRVRSKMKSDFPRVTVFRSLKQIYVQIIDDNAAHTLVSCSSKDLGAQVHGDKSAVALAVGKELAARALKKGVSRVIFDRGAYLFHGRIKALAQGLIEGGITI